MPLFKSHCNNLKTVMRGLFYAVLVLSSAWAQDRMYVVQGLDESLGEINLNNDQVRQHVLDLGYGCNDIILAGNRLYVTNSLLNSVQEIDPATNTTLRNIPVVGGVNPYACALLNPDTLVVSNWVSNNLALIRLSDGATVGTVPTGIGPEGIVVNGDHVLVCITRYLPNGTFGPGLVMVYDRSTMAFIDSISVGTNPQSAIADSWNRLHVACTGDYSSHPGQIDIINLETLRKDTVLAIGGSPAAISFGGDRAFVAAGGWAGHGDVLSYRLAGLAIVNDGAHPLATGLGATDVEGRADGTFLVSCFSEATVEHRSATGQLLHSYPLSTGPGQMVFVPGANAASPSPETVPANAELLEAFPNPFNGGTNFRFGTSSRSVSYLTIYNEIGQLVDQVSVPPLTEQMAWSPRGNTKSAVSSGIYYVRWTVNGRQIPYRLIYLR
jgi:YVTN family beta-propeller protein